MKPGDILYIDSGSKAVPETISKVGRKYFYLEGDRHERKYDKNTLIHKGHHTYTLYKTEQEITEKHEKTFLVDKLTKAFSWQNIRIMSLEKLRKVSDILEH